MHTYKYMYRYKYMYNIYVCIYIEQGVLYLTQFTHMYMCVHVAMDAVVARA